MVTALLAPSAHDEDVETQGGHGNGQHDHARRRQHRAAMHVLRYQDRPLQDIVHDTKLRPGPSRLQLESAGSDLDAVPGNR